MRPPADAERGAARSRRRYYKFGHGGLCLTCDDLEFFDRFQFLFAECASSPVELDGLPLFFAELTTNPASSTSVLTFSGTESVDYLRFILELFPERNLRVLPDTKSTTWRYLAEPGAKGSVMAVGGNQLLMDRSYGWQAIVAQFVVSNVMRLQRHVRFFHAATVGIGDRGVLIIGAKGSGKTTLSLALAARSHAFLGEEYAAVCVRTGALLPFRRAVSIRPGARAARLEDRLQHMNLHTEKAQDGLHRVRVSVCDLFPEAAPRAVELTHCFFLRGFRHAAAAVEFAPGEMTLPALQPLLASLWSQRPGMLMMELLRVLSRTRCFYMDVGGTPDEAADVIERVVEGR